MRGDPFNCRECISDQLLTSEPHPSNGDVAMVCVCVWGRVSYKILKGGNKVAREVRHCLGGSGGMLFGEIGTLRRGEFWWVWAYF